MFEQHWIDKSYNGLSLHIVAGFENFKYTNCKEWINNDGQLNRTVNVLWVLLKSEFLYNALHIVNTRKRFFKQKKEYQEHLELM